MEGAFREDIICFSVVTTNRKDAELADEVVLISFRGKKLREK